MSAKQYPRIFLWSAPRTISTAFFRAMENRENIKVFLEPFSYAYFFGKDKISDYYTKTDLYPEHNEYSLDDVYNSLINVSDDCPVFAKDHALHILCRDNPLNYVPAGYDNAFIFRDPRKSFISGYRMCKLSYCDPSLDAMKKHFASDTFSMKNVWDLYQMIQRQNPGKKILVIDGDDLVKEPEKVLRSFCSHFGLEYEESMLDWSGNKSKPTLVDKSLWKVFFSDVLESHTISNEINKKNAEMMSKEELPEFIEKLIQDDLIYYEKLLAVKNVP